MPYVEQQIKEAMERGDFDNLPNKGKPLDLRRNPFENPEMRLAYKILKDNGYAPPWIELEKDICGDLERKEKILEFLKHRRQRLAVLIAESPRSGQSIAKTFELERHEMLCLSATIPNLSELADCINDVRNRDVAVIEETERPVPLEHAIFIDNFSIGVIGYYSRRRGVAAHRMYKQCPAID